MDPADAAGLDEGIRLFNAGKHWHAHEAWEHLWLRLDGEDKRFVQGLIMAAAMLVQYGKGVRRGVVNHHQNVVDRLAEVRTKWSIDVHGLLEQLEPYAHDALAEGVYLKRDPGAVRIRRDASTDRM